MPLPTVTDNLYFQDIISSYVLSISFEPPIDGPAVNGELTFGGTDPTKFVGEIFFAYVASLRYYISTSPV